MRLMAVTLLLALAACGADDPPLRPTAGEPAPTVTVGGSVQMGVNL